MLKVYTNVTFLRFKLLYLKHLAEREEVVHVVPHEVDEEHLVDEEVLFSSFCFFTISSFFFFFHLFSFYIILHFFLVSMCMYFSCL